MRVRKATVIHVAWLLAQAANEFRRDGCWGRAAALCYITMLALVPLAVVAFSVFAAFSSLSIVREEIGEFLFKLFVPTSTDLIREYLTRFSHNAGTLGIVGTLILIGTAVLVIYNIEKAFDEIWRAERRRSWVHQVAIIWSMLTLVPILVVLSTAYTAGISSFLAEQLFPGIDAIPQAISSLVPLLCSCAAFILVYHFLPNRRLSIQSTVTGAVVAGALWELAKIAFKGFVVGTGTYDKVYGTLGALPAFMVWLYITWAIVLYGAEVAYVVQRRHILKLERSRDKLQAGYADYLGLRIMLRVHQNFVQMGTPTTLRELADDLRREERHLLGILHRLRKKRLLLPVADQENEYVPGRPTNQISLKEVLDAVREEILRIPPGEDETAAHPIHRLFESLQDAADAVLSQETVESLARRTSQYRGDQTTPQDQAQPL